MVQEPVDQIHNLLRHSGGEEQSLLPLRQPGQNLPHVVNEPHVQHPVRLVQDEDLQPGQVQQALAVQVGQAAGGGDEDIRAGLDGVYLGLLAHAAEDHDALQGQVSPVGLHLLLVLDGQLPGGGQDQGADGPALRRMLVQPLEDRRGKSAGLPGAGTGAAQHVPALQRRGDGSRLDGGSLGVALFRQVLPDWLD